MNSEWRLVKLKDICVVDWGNTKLTKKAFVEGGRFLGVSAAGCDGRVDHFEHEKGTPVLSAIGAKCGRMFFPDEKFTAIKNTITLTPVYLEVTNRFLYYLLTHVRLPQRGAGQPFISKGDIQKFEVRIPPIPDQKRIVTILDEAFEGIDSVVANTEKNLANSREIFDSYLNLIFSQMDKESLGHKLENMCERITKGSSPKWQGIEYVDNPGVLFVTSENVGQNRMVFNKNKYVDLAFNKKDSKSILKNGDVLTNIVGASIGRTSVFDRNDLANINQAVCLIRCDPGKLVNLYLSYLLNSPFFRKILHENEIDNARANLSLGFFKNLSIPVPNIEMQLEIVEGAKSLEVECDRLGFIYQQKLTALAELKQSLLHKAFSGELTAKGAEAAVEEATV